MNSKQESLEEILDSYAKYQYQLYVDNDGSYQLNKREASEAIQAYCKQQVIEGRLIELDLLEQAINQGRDMNEYKMMRLKDLELKEQE